MIVHRSSGVQLHVTSLPSGRLDGDAYAFVDWLAAAGQSFWQVLPLGPPDAFGSPYRSRSAFACSPALLADPDAPVSPGEEDDLREREHFWIGDWARFAGGRSAIRDQVRFAREWESPARLRRRGGGPAVRRPAAVRRGAQRRPPRASRALPARPRRRARPRTPSRRAASAGATRCMTGPRCSAGATAGGPSGCGARLALFDLVRIDHFRGFVAYWSIPARARDAAGGRWCRGPGGAPFEAARAELGELPLVAEDLGSITPAVERARASLGFPGMVVLQFAFGGGGRNVLGGAHPWTVAYTGTHDHPTLQEWWRELDGDRRARVRAALRARGIRWQGDARAHIALIRLAFSSPAMLAMIQAADLLGLGPEGRMNIPGRAGGNWDFRLHRGQLTPALARTLRAASEDAGRAS